MPTCHDLPTSSKHQLSGWRFPPSHCSQNGLAEHSRDTFRSTGTGIALVVIGIVLLILSRIPVYINRRYHVVLWVSCRPSAAPSKPLSVTEVSHWTACLCLPAAIIGSGQSGDAGVPGPAAGRTVMPHAAVTSFGHLRASHCTTTQQIAWLGC